MSARADVAEDDPPSEPPMSTRWDARRTRFVASCVVLLDLVIAGWTLFGLAGIADILRSWESLSGGWLVLGLMVSQGPTALALLFSASVTAGVWMQGAHGEPRRRAIAATIVAACLYAVLWALVFAAPVKHGSAC